MAALQLLTMPTSPSKEVSSGYRRKCAGAFWALILAATFSVSIPVVICVWCFSILIQVVDVTCLLFLCKTLGLKGHWRRKMFCEICLNSRKGSCFNFCTSLGLVSLTSLFTCWRVQGWVFFFPFWGRFSMLEDIVIAMANSWSAEESLDCS